MAVSVRSIKPNIGAIIEVERARLLDEAVVAKCLELLEERVVVVFPRIGLTDAEQLAFTDSLGTRVNFTRGLRTTSDIDPDIYRVTLDPKLTPEPEYVQATFFWHMDGLTVDMPPTRASLLSARRVATKGGQRNSRAPMPRISTYRSPIRQSSSGWWRGIAFLRTCATSPTQRRQNRPQDGVPRRNGRSCGRIVRDVSRSSSVPPRNASSTCLYRKGARYSRDYWSGPCNQTLRIAISGKSAISWSGTIRVRSTA